MRDELEEKMRSCPAEDLLVSAFVFTDEASSREIISYSQEGLVAALVGA